MKAHSDIVVIVMNENGFEPNEVTVHKNEAIMFINKDNGSRWPASNIHPTHELYPEFDPKSPIEAEKSWAFRPQNTGAWKYHDHLKPHMRGIITVKEEDIQEKIEPVSFLTNFKIKINNIFKNIISLFKKSPDNLKQPDFKSLDQTAQFKFLENLTSAESAERSWKFLQETYQGEAGSQGNIHDLAHFVGNLLYKKKGIDGLSNCTSQFAFGCYHGFLDTAFAQSLEHLSDAEKTCLSLGPPLSGPNASCIHGIGHGIASFYNTTNLPNALSSCDKLTEGEQFCYDGVFMEFVRGAGKNSYKESDPLYPCNTLEKKYVFACSRNQPNVWMDRFHFSSDKIIQTCLKALDTDFKNACFDNIGFTLTRVHSQNINEIQNGCQKIESEKFRARCIQAAAGELIFQDAKDWQKNAPALCNTLKYGYQKACLKYLQNLKKEYKK